MQEKYGLKKQLNMMLVFFDAPVPYGHPELAVVETATTITTTKATTKEDKEEEEEEDAAGDR